MKRSLKKMAASLVVCVMALSISCTGSSMTAQAASKKWKKACKSYGTWLSKNQSRFTAQEGDFYTKNNESYQKADYFLLADLDQNGVPELVIKHPIAYKMDSIYIYTYKAGKVRQVKNESGKTKKLGNIDISANAAGRYEVYACKKKHLHVFWNGGWMGSDEKIYTIKKNSLYLYARCEDVNPGGFSHNSPNCLINGRSASSEKYRKLTGRCGGSTGSFVKNTKVFRKKYLK